MKIANKWLALGVTALGLSGLFTILLIIGRTTNSLPDHFFSPSLIVHVNLSVLVWLLAIAVSHFNIEPKRHSIYPFVIASIGTAAITISPFMGQGVAYENNYIPIFDNLVFKAGIAAFIGAVAYESITTLFSKTGSKNKTLAALIVMSFAAIAYSYSDIVEKTSSHYLYEYLFWGGGHILQFAYVQIMLIAWLAIAEKGGLRAPAKNKTINAIFLLPVIFAAASSIFIYASAPVESADHIQMFTKQMIFGTSIAAIPLGLLLFIPLCIGFRFTLYPVTLAFSILMFAVGGALGNLAAEGVARGEITTIIPAHYHFSTVAVTVALMGYIFTRLNLQHTRLATWQITLYSLGQIIYFTGMAILGGHGAARKTPGMDIINMEESSREMVQHIMRSGGSLSLIGGILFVVIVIKAMRGKKINPVQ